MIVYYGNDEFLVDDAVKQIIKEKYTNFKLIKLSYDIEINTLYDLIFQSSIFDDKKIIWIKNWDLVNKKSIKKNEQFHLLNIFNNLGNIPIIFSHFENFSNSDFGKLINSKAQFNQVDKMSFNDKINYLTEYAKDQNISISSNLLSYLISLVPDNTTMIINELNKLQFIDKVITKEIIDQSFSFYVKEENYDFINSLATKNVHLIIKNYNEELMSGIDPILLMGKISSILILANVLDNFVKEKGNLDEAIKILKINTFRARSVYAIIKIYGKSKILSLINELQNLDFRIKKTWVNPRVALDYFMLKVLQ